MKGLGTWSDPTVFGAFQIVSVAVLATLYGMKILNGGKNPVIENNPFDEGNVLTFPRSVADLPLTPPPATQSISWTLFAPANAPTPHGLSFTSCACPSKANS